MWIVGIETLCSQLWKYYHSYQAFLNADGVYTMLDTYNKNRSFVKYLHLEFAFPSM